MCHFLKRKREGGKYFCTNNPELIFSHILEDWQYCSLYAHRSFGHNLDRWLLVSVGHRCLGDNRNNWSLSKATECLLRVAVKDMKAERKKLTTLAKPRTASSQQDAKTEPHGTSQMLSVEYDYQTVAGL